MPPIGGRGPVLGVARARPVAPGHRVHADDATTVGGVASQFLRMCCHRCWCASK